MGQKVNPVGMRLGITGTWGSRWFAGSTKKYAQMVNLDREIRSFLSKKFKDAGVSKIDIDRSNKQTHISVFTARPGMIIGRDGTHIETLKKDLHRQFHQDFEVAIKEVKNPDLEAGLLVQMVAQQIERRVAFRRAAKMAVQKAMEAGAKGVKVFLSGRLGGAEIARNEFFLEGKIPLHTFRADISYAEGPALTTYGAIGIKVWVYRGEVFKKKAKEAASTGEKS